MSQPLEVKAKFTIDPQGEKSVLALAAAWEKAARAERAYHEQSQKHKQQADAQGAGGGGSGGSGGGLPGTGAAARALPQEQLDVLQQTVRDREEHFRVMGAKRRAAEEAQAQVRADRARAQRESSAAAATERQTLLQTVAGEFGPTAGAFAHAGSKLAAARTLAGVAAPAVGMAALSAREVVGMQNQQAEDAAKVNAPEFQKRYDRWTSYGFGVGRANAALAEWRRGQAGRPEIEALANDSLARHSIRASGEQARRAIENTLEHDRSAALTRSAAVGGTTLDRAKTIDRSRVLGERLYAEELRLLPIRQALTKVEADRLAAEKTAAADAGAVNFTRALLDRKTLDHKKAAEELTRFGGTATLKEAFTGRRVVDLTEKEVTAKREMDAARAQYEARIEIAKGSTARLDEKAAAKRGVQADFERAKLADLQGREQTAAGQALRLGGLSRAEFHAAKIQLGILQRQGLENTPGDVVAGASTINAEFVRKEQEKLGSQRARELGLPEYRDDLATVRRQVDEQQGKVTGAEEAAWRQDAKDEGVRLGQYIGEAMRLVTAGVRAELEQILLREYQRSSNVNKS